MIILTIGEVLVKHVYMYGCVTHFTIPPHPNEILRWATGHMNSHIPYSTGFNAHYSIPHMFSKFSISISSKFWKGFQSSFNYDR